MFLFHRPARNSYCCAMTPLSDQQICHYVWLGVAGAGQMMFYVRSRTFFSAWCLGAHGVSIRHSSVMSLLCTFVHAHPLLCSGSKAFACTSYPIEATELPTGACRASRDVTCIHCSKHVIGIQQPREQWGLTSIGALHVATVASFTVACLRHRVLRVCCRLP